jgi:hypothetical protein
MYNTNIPSDRELPSTAKLIKSTLGAIVIALVLLVTVVMPSEYGIDPTGLGKITGLQHMGEIKVALAQEAAEETIKDVEVVTIIENRVKEPELKLEPELQIIAEETAPIQSHERQVILAPDEGTEIKLTMIKGAKVEYSWETNGGKANFDVHGDSKELNINYHNYSKGSTQKKSGTLVAGFDGGHGWFWRNRTKAALTITLKTQGEYTDIKRY